MADQVKFELVSPERLLLSEEVDSVVIPGAEGDFGVLPGHSRLISTIRPGVITVFEGGRTTDRIFVEGGFAEVTPQGCTVLAERAPTWLIEMPWLAMTPAVVPEPSSSAPLWMTSAPLPEMPT